MTDFTVTYLNGEVKEITSPGLSYLVKDHFNDSKEELKSMVEMITWRSDGVFYARDVQADETSSQLITADVNPYGWRNT